VNAPRIPGPCWSTACFGEAADPSPLEMSGLGDHLQACRALCGRLFRLGCAVEAAMAFLAARVVTSLLALALLVGLALWAC
jgi:hypothetical protein